MPDLTLGPSVAGRWYPAAEQKLRAEVDRLVQASPSRMAEVSRLAGVLRAVIAPHAGYVYSGAVAATAFAPFAGRHFERVFLLGPSHYHGFRGATIPAASGLRTPLGTVEIHRQTLETLRRIPGFSVSDVPFEPEHSLESEIPFLQHLLAPGWKAVPVLVGAPSSSQDVGHIAAGLSPLLDRGSLLVISSDFTHHGDAFGYAPFRERIPERIEALDRGAVQHIETGDAEGFDAYCEATGATICGRKAISVLLRLAGVTGSGALLGYDTSGRMTGDWSHTVSYAAVGLGLECA